MLRISWLQSIEVFFSNIQYFLVSSWERLSTGHDWQMGPTLRFQNAVSVICKKFLPTPSPPSHEVDYNIERASSDVL